MLLALVLPSTVPLWIVLLGDAVAVIIAKGLFGGIGSNVFNPALTGRAVLVISFPAVLGARWFDPVLAKTNEAVSNFDAVTSATLLSSVKHGNTDAFNFVNYFLGNRAGCIGETSILLILISFIFLLVTKIIDWRAPVAMILTVALGTFFSGLGKGLKDVPGLGIPAVPIKRHRIYEIALQGLAKKRSQGKETDEQGEG